MKNKNGCVSNRFERVEKVDTLLDGSAVRRKFLDFRTALHSRQYHPRLLENRLLMAIFAYKVFFRRTCHRKNKMRSSRYAEYKT